MDFSQMQLGTGLRPLGKMGHNTRKNPQLSEELGAGGDR